MCLVPDKLVPQNVWVEVDLILIVTEFAVLRVLLLLFTLLRLKVFLLRAQFWLVRHVVFLGLVARTLFLVD